MCQTCLIKLNNTICNIEMSDEFGQLMTESGTANVHVPLPHQLFCDMAHPDPFDKLAMRECNAGTIIRDYLRNLIEDYINDNRSICTCTDLERLLFILDELEITCLPIDGNGDVDRSGAPLLLDQHLDLRQFLKTHTMNHAITQINQPSGGPISFQPALVHTFNFEASHVEMPPNWQVDKVLDADKIATIRFPGIKAALTKAAAAMAASTGTSSAHSDELMKKLIDAQVLLASNLDPRTFGRAIATAVSSTMTASKGTIGTQVSAGIEKAIKDTLIPALQAGIPTLTMTKSPKINDTTAVHMRGSPSNHLTPLLGPNETIGDFIVELPKTSGKTPRVGTWKKLHKMSTVFSLVISSMHPTPIKLTMEQRNYTWSNNGTNKSYLQDMLTSFNAWFNY
jgi:hypothetical protein